MDLLVWQLEDHGLLQATQPAISFPSAFTHGIPIICESCVPGLRATMSSQISS
jgi:hypothetical protein